MTVQVAKLDHEDPPAAAVLRDLEKVDHTGKATAPSQIGRPGPAAAAISGRCR
jgi:hypothetical protein